jgi:hypothetical protein
MEKSIFYEGNSKDLTIHLLFENKENARDFQNALSNFRFQHPSFHQKILFDQKLQQVSTELIPEPVFYDNYQGNDNSDSPPFLSLNDILSSHSESVLSNNGDPETQRQSLEDLSKFPKLKCYRCHIISATNKDHHKDPDNAIYGSWMFHQYFDALNTETRIPELAVKFDSVAEEEEVPVADKYEKRWKINVLVEFRDQEVAETVSLYFKSGTQRVPNNPLIYQSFLYARNPENMKYFLDFKYDETTKLW